MNRLGAWVALTAATLALAGLGVWQLRRHFEAAQRAEGRAAAGATAPSPAPVPDRLDRDETRHLRVVCALGTEAAFVVAAPRPTGPGLRLLRPCALPDGRRIGVDLGWVRQDDAAAALGVSVEAPIDGLLIDPGPRRDAAGQSGPAGVALYPPGAAASALQSWKTSPVLLVRGPPVEDAAHAPIERPIAAGWEIRPPARPHLGYAAFWLASAVLLAVQVGPKLRQA